MTDKDEDSSPDIDSLLVRKLIDQQFPQWSDLTIKPVATSGWDNRTFHLGDAFSVRLPSASHYARAVEIEQIWLPVLADKLPLPIPQPMAHGQPCDTFPWPWSVYRWLPGETAAAGTITDMNQFAADLANFLNALYNIDPTGGPSRTMRGGRLDIWNKQMRLAIEKLALKIDVAKATEIWELALAVPMDTKNIWFHGDVAAGNLLVSQGRLSAVIDFGGVGIGDPGCDMAIAWTFLDKPSRDIFRSQLNTGSEVWQRGRGWALWKALILKANLIQTNEVEAASADRTIRALLGETW